MTGGPVTVVLGISYSGVADLRMMSLRRVFAGISDVAKFWEE